MGGLVGLEVKVGIIGDGAEEALQLVETQADGLPLPLLLSWVEEELPAGHRPGLPGRRRAGGWLPDSRRWRPAAARRPPWYWYRRRRRARRPAARACRTRARRT